MDAQTAISSGPRNLRRGVNHLDRLSRAVPAALTALLVAAAVMLVARRAAGALVDPLSPFLLVVAAWVMVCPAAAIRWLRRDTAETAAPEMLSAIMRWTPTAALVALGASVSLPGTPPVALMVFWAVIVAEQTWAIVLTRPGVVPPSSSPVDGKTAHGGRSTRRLSARQDADEDDADGGDVEIRFDPPHEHGPRAPEGDLWQQTARYRAADGTDVLQGSVRVDLLAGQRYATVHLAVCPPFEHVPVLSLNRTAGPPARIKTTQCLPYGARLEIKLATAGASPAQFHFDFTARCAPVADRPPDAAPSQAQIVTVIGE